MQMEFHSRSLRSPLMVMSVLFACLPIFVSVEAQHQNSMGVGFTEVKEYAAMAKRFALVIGVDQYQDAQIAPLSSAVNDAKALADALVRYAGFPPDQVELLTSDQAKGDYATRVNILTAMARLRRLVPEDGLLFVSFAGHGIEQRGRAFLCPSDTRISGSIDFLEATAIPVETLGQWIRETKVKQAVLILDASRHDPTGRALVWESGQEKQNRLTDGFAQQYNFDLRNEEVTVFAVLYATGVGQVAYHYKEKKQGYFSWALVEGLKGRAANEKGEVTLGRLIQYVAETVPKIVALHIGTGREQRPFSTVEGYKADELVLAVIPTDTLAKKSTTSNESNPDDRGIGVKARNGLNLKKTGTYYALIIGIQDYKIIEKLETPIADAKQLERILRDAYDFETRLLINAKRDEIIKAFNDYQRALQEGDSLLIYYAGHGFNDRKVNKAYWLPVDAEKDYRANWISADDITTNLRGIDAKHILVIADSCYSGMITRESGASLTPVERERALRKLINEKCRVLISSGGDEPVADGGCENHSIFACALLHGLERAEDHIFTAGDLFHKSIREAVAGKSNQLPQYMVILNSGHEGGDFVFFRKK